MRNGWIWMLIVLTVAATAMGAANPPDIASAITHIRSSDPATARQAIADLRAAGPGGLAALLRDYDLHPDAKLLPAIDAVAGQHDAVFSRLYWYTDLAQAEAAAKAQRKPILYLRLLGKLTDQYSCANSRFFRTVLYSNRQVSAMLRQQFVLVWVSERPVPVVTIDYGDGRVLKRTITGNSVHYVLDSEGKVFDVFPGLFDPLTFRKLVSDAGNALERGISRGEYLKSAEETILRNWQRDTAGPTPANVLYDDGHVEYEGKYAPAAPATQPNDQAPRAMVLTFSKARIEAPLLAEITPQMARQMERSIDSVDDATWKRLANLHLADATLDDQSLALIRSQNRATYADPLSLQHTVLQFQQSIAEDSVRDQYQMRRKVLAWLRDARSPIAVEDLNRRVYTELFLTPRSDPWLGLAPQGQYTALPDDGQCNAPASDQSHADAR
jgi:hypothetical protein